MSSLRLAMVNQAFGPTFTGRGLQLRALSQRLARRDVQVDIITERLPDLPAQQSFGHPPVRIHRVPLEKRQNPLATWWDRRHLVRRLRALEPDVLQVFGRPQGIEALLLAARTLKIATIFTPTMIASDDLPSIRRDGRLGWLRAMAYRSADHFVAICPAIAESFLQGGVSADRVSCIPNGVDTDQFEPSEDPQQVARRLGWAPDKPRALFVGAIVRRKGIDVLLEAWSRVLDRVPDAQLYLAGPVAGRTITDNEAFIGDCREFIAARSMSEHVHMLGKRDDTPLLYQAADVFVFASRREGFPNVLLEAMSSGLPIVTTRIAGSTDSSVRDGVTGFVVEQEDARKLADRTVEVLREESLRQDMSLAARRRALSLYRFDTVAEQYRDLYTTLSD